MHEGEKALVKFHADFNQAVLALAQAESELLKRKFMLETLIDAKLIAGEIVGKNEREREAHARTLLADDFATVATLEAQVIFLKAQVRVASSNCDMARLQLQYRELEMKQVR